MCLHRCLCNIKYNVIIVGLKSGKEMYWFHWSIEIVSHHLSCIWGWKVEQRIRFGRRTTFLKLLKFLKFRSFLTAFPSVQRDHRFCDFNFKPDHDHGFAKEVKTQEIQISVRLVDAGAKHACNYMIFILVFITIKISIAGLVRLKHFELTTSAGWAVSMNTAFSYLTSRLQHLELNCLHPLRQVSVLKCCWLFSFIRSKWAISAGREAQKPCFWRDFNVNDVSLLQCRFFKTDIIVIHAYIHESLGKSFQYNFLDCFMLQASSWSDFVVRCYQSHAHRQPNGWCNWHFHLQAIPVPHATCLTFSNHENLRQDHFPFILEDSLGLRSLSWSGRAAHLKQLEMLNRISLSHLTRMSLSSSYGRDDTSSASISLDTHLQRAFVHLHSLRDLVIKNCRLTASGLLVCLLPLVR